jgi:hypothetical protein
MMRNDCEKEECRPAQLAAIRPGISLIEARRVTHSSPPIVLELELELVLVLDPSV